MRDIYLILNTAIAIALVVLSLMSLINDRKPLVNKLFVAFSFCIGVWLIAACVSNDTRQSQEVSLYGNYLVFFFSYFSSYLLLWFSVLIVDLKLVKKIMKIANLPVALVGITSLTPLVVAGVEVSKNVYAVIFGPLAILYGLFLIAFLIFTLIVFHNGIKHSSGHKKTRILVIQRSLIISIPILIITQFIAPILTGSFEVTDIGILVMAIPVISLYISVIRHGLFDIRQAIIRTSAYILSLTTLAIAYYFLAYLVSILLFKGNVASGVSVGPINIVMALVLAFFFQPIKDFFDKVTDSIFYKDRYSTDDFFANLNKTLSYSTNLRSLIERVSVEISQTLKAEQAFFFINIDEDHFISDGTVGHRQLPKDDAVRLSEAVGERADVIVASLLRDDNPIKRMMVSHRVELILPLIQNKKPLGYLCLGEHRTSNYTDRDIKVLNTISSELIIAIQNALAVQEIREFNMTLQQRIANATVELRSSNRMLRQLDKAKDEFVGMASHQLRTPLTSVKGYISMVLDGDAGKISSSQRQLLSEAFNSSERMVNLINDFLNVSRIQTGKFLIERTPVNIAKLIDQEIDNLRSTAEAHNLKFIYNPPTDFPIIKVDESKIKQVVMNFLDNSIYYSIDGSSVYVNLLMKGDNIVFTVKDSGIGVPKSEVNQLFTKFYRATNARTKRPDGTGVGIYLAKKIIDAHEGKVIFESVEGSGSTFGFSLPIK